MKLIIDKVLPVIRPSVGGRGVDDVIMAMHGIPSQQRVMVVQSIGDIWLTNLSTNTGAIK